MYLQQINTKNRVFKSKPRQIRRSCDALDTGRHFSNPHLRLPEAKTDKLAPILHVYKTQTNTQNAEVEWHKQTLAYHRTHTKCRGVGSRICRSVVNNLTGVEARTFTAKSTPPPFPCVRHCRKRDRNSHTPPSTCSFDFRATAETRQNGASRQSGSLVGQLVDLWSSAGWSAGRGRKEYRT